MIKNIRKYKYPYNLIMCVMGYDEYEQAVEATKNADDLEISVEYALSKLSPNERDVIHHRFRDYLTLSQCGYLMSKSAQYISQIGARALRRLRRPDLRKFMLNGITNVIAEKDDELKETQKIARIKSNTVSLSDLDLPTRIYNALDRRCVNTVDDIAKMSRDELLKISGFGETSYNELLKALNKFGYTIDESSDHQQNNPLSNLPDDEWRNLPLYDTGIPSYLLFMRSGYNTPADFSGKTYYDILLVRGIGEVKASITYEMLKSHSIELVPGMPDYLPIEVLKIAAHARKWLYLNDIRTIKDLVNTTETELITTCGLMQSEVDAIKRRLTAHNFSLKSEG